MLSIIKELNLLDFVADTFIIIEIDEDSLIKHGLNQILEGNWNASNFSNIYYRVDPENPSIKTQRHIHIAKKKHITSKNMQVSWNKNGTRHDKKSFNEKINSANVQEIAREVLNLPKTTILEDISEISKECYIIESAGPPNQCIKCGHNIFHLKVK